MGQMNVKGVDIKYMGADSVQGKQDVKEASEDFKKLLQGKAEDQREVPDSPVKSEEKSEEGKDTVEASDETKTAAVAAAVAAMQTGQMLHSIVGAEETAPVPMQEAGVPAAAGAETVEAMAEAFPETIVQEETAQVEEKPASIQEAADPKTVEAGTPERAQQLMQQPVQAEQAQEQPADGREFLNPKQEAKEGTVQANVRKDIQPKAPERAQEADSSKNDGIAAAAAQEQQIQAPVNEAPTAVEDTKPVYTQNMQVSQPEEIPQKLAEEVIAKAAEGVREMEIQIEPAHLGKIAIKLLYAAGQATISIVCSERRTLELIGQNARELGYMMEQNLGEKTTVIVERQETDYLYQGENENDHTGRDSEQERQREENEKEKAPDPEQFLQKLRLGLTG